MKRMLSRWLSVVLMIAITLPLQKCEDLKQDASNTTASSTMTTSKAIVSITETAATAWTTDADYGMTLSPNETFVGKPSKFDEHVEEWQYVDSPLWNATAESGNYTSNVLSPPPAPPCKTCAIKPRDKRHQDRPSKSKFATIPAHKAIATGVKSAYRLKRIRRSAVAFPSATGADMTYPSPAAYRRRHRYRYYEPSQHPAVTAWDRNADFRRRYLRFPPTHDAPPPPPSFSGWAPSGPSVLGPVPQSPYAFHHSPQPAMGPRSPRLVFRDPVDSGTLQAPFGPPSGLQDLLISPADEGIKGCGVSVVKQQGAQRRIVGGDEAGFGSFPWQAYIRIGSSRCGGSLVNRYHVVTAGHCVARASARQVQVTLGDYVINSAVEPLPAYTFGVRKISVHPYFKFTPQADRFDVAVLKLDRPVQYMPHIAPICLPEKGEDFLGQYGWAAGWGALQAGSRLRPKTLQAVDVPIIDNRQCEKWHKSNGINVIIYDEMMCAGYREGSKDSCQGDSGGPLMLEKTGRWYLIGIVSAGYSCAQRGQPGIYHRVPLTVDWISYVINSQ
ncbi:serine protease 42-like isoform X8 [Daktulosphaira vitifoliae]|uniref:serine protease 42-like isoform X6 n=1 Tax=Daktulosphaira vitifoliae TaxID=58002 RepID=UPI0021AACCB2|nr:serine protease 42-like isoform X6 [Daktulosphaira vitifoliae]XP_050531488.1 serine protease 42-like isoform X7 [Daktulosphaira vitifoliae]XP_050531489.1 serine protease 42-like isoform X8 [Daktulosphaira vitifoliae]